MEKKIKHVDFANFYKIPDWYQPPPTNKLDECHDYPNLNSTNYRNLPPNSDSFENFYELLETNKSRSTFILAANSYTGRTWNGSLYLYNHVNDIGSMKKFALRSKFKSTISNVRFLDDNIILLTDYCGSIEMWSTQSPMRNQNGYSLFNITSKNDALNFINAIDLLPGENGRKVITASADCSIRIWNIGSVDLISDRIYKYAHSDIVEDVSSKPSEDSLFCSCSYDRSFAIWDSRMTKPVIDSHDNHSVAYTACKWTANNKIYVGDESGNLHIYDVQNLEMPVQTINVFNRPIYRMKLNENYLTVIGNTNNFKIFDISNDNVKLIYDNVEADDFVRDCCWLNDNKKKMTKQFCTVGYNKHVKRHELKIE